MLKIWGRINSINVQKVLWCCGELELPFDRVDAGMQFGVNNTLEYKALNPNALVPMIDDSGYILWESQAIVRYLTVQRTLAPNWQDYETLSDVVMVPLDANVKTIDPNSSEAFQVVRGSESSDKDGERQGTLLFPKGTDATMELPNGQTKPVDELKLRAIIERHSVAPK